MRYAFAFLKWILYVLGEFFFHSLSLDLTLTFCPFRAQRLRLPRSRRRAPPLWCAPTLTLMSHSLWPVPTRISAFSHLFRCFFYPFLSVSSFSVALSHFA